MEKESQIKSPQKEFRQLRKQLAISPETLTESDRDRLDQLFAEIGDEEGGEIIEQVFFDIADEENKKEGLQELAEAVQHKRRNTDIHLH